MNIALIGYGQMGRKIHQIAMQKGHNIVSIIDPFALEANYKTLSPQSFNNADVAIDFSHPSSVLLNIETTLEAEIPLIIEKTGAYGINAGISHFLSHQMPPEILISNNSWKIIRERGSHNDLFLNIQYNSV